LSLCIISLYDEDCLEKKELGASTAVSLQTRRNGGRSISEVAPWDTIDVIFMKDLSIWNSSIFLHLSTRVFVFDKTLGWSA